MVSKIYKVMHFGVVSVVELSDEFIVENNRLNPNAQVVILEEIKENL